MYPKIVLLSVVYNRSGVPWHRWLSINKTFESSRLDELFFFLDPIYILFVFDFLHIGIKATSENILSSSSEVTIILQILLMISSLAIWANDDGEII